MTYALSDVRRQLKVLLDTLVWYESNFHTSIEIAEVRPLIEEVILRLSKAEHARDLEAFPSARNTKRSP